jgi:hypothetical protein
MQVFGWAQGKWKRWHDGAAATSEELGSSQEAERRFSVRPYPLRSGTVIVVST